MLSAAADIAPRVRARARRAAAGTPAAARSALASAASAAAASSARASGHQGAGFPATAPGGRLGARAGRSRQALAGRAGRTGWHGVAGRGDHRLGRPPPRAGPEHHGSHGGRQPPEPRPRRPGRRAGPRPASVTGVAARTHRPVPGYRSIRPARPVASANSRPIDTIAAAARRSTPLPDPPPSPRATRAAAGTIPATAPTSRAPDRRPAEPGPQQPAPRHGRAEQPVRGGLRHRDRAPPGRVTQQHQEHQQRQRGQRGRAGVQQPRGRRGRGRRVAQRPVRRDDQRAAVADHDERGQVGPVGDTGRLLPAAAPAQLAQQREGRRGGVRDGDGVRVTVTATPPASRPAAPRR